jgi:hypothetical protein
MRRFLKAARAVLLLGSAAASGQGNCTEPDVFAPEPGVRCDRGEQVCTDARGSSFVWTRTQFGLEAALRLAEQAQLVVNPDGSAFRIDATGSCDLSLRICYRDARPDAELTREHFGAAGVERMDDFRQRLDASDDKLVEPGRGLGCLRSARICYDQDGPSVALTRLGFGNDAALRLLRSLLKRQAADNEFTDEG